MPEPAHDPGLCACLYQPPFPGEAGGRRDEAPGVATHPDVRDDGSPGPVIAEAPADRRRLPPVISVRSSSLVAIAAEFSPRYEQHRADLVSIDVRGLSRLLGTPRVIGAELRREAASRGVRVHVAVAPTRTAALVLSVARPGLTVVGADGMAEALAPVSLNVLEQLH